MLRQSTFAALLWLLAIALLPVRMAHAHLHMCLDGKDKPVAVHVGDVPTHHGSAAASSGHDDAGHNDAGHNDAGHNNVDVDVSASAIAKKAGPIDEVTLDLLGAYVLALLLPARQPALLPTAPLTSELTACFELRPPSR